MKEYDFDIDYYEDTDLEEINAFLRSHFQNFTIICTDGLKYVQYMSEAFRGFLIARGRTIGRHPIRCVEIERENGKLGEESIFQYKGIPIGSRFGKTHHFFRAFSDSNEWADEVVDIMSRFPRVKGIEKFISEPQGEIFGFYADVKRRLEEGDIEGGTQHSIADRPIGDFEKHFPQYRHLFQSNKPPE